MSDTEDLEIPVEEELSKTEKKKKVMTPEALERLAKARIRAAEVKRAARKAKDEKENEIKEKVKKEQLEKMEKKVRNSMIDLSSESATLSGEDEQAEVIKKPKKPKKKPVVIVEQDSSSSDDDSNVVYIKRRSRKPKNAPAKDVLPQEQQLPPIQIGYAPRSMPPRPFNSFY